MRGEFIGVWSETHREIWEELAVEEAAPGDLFCELYRALTPALRVQPTVEALAEITADPAQSRELFLATTRDDFLGERALVAFLETAHDVLDDLGDDPLTNRYFNLLQEFIEKYSLRYDLRRPCLLCPTLPGVFTKLIRDLRAAVNLDAHLNTLMNDFEEAIRDLRHDCTDGRIRMCIQRQMNLLEALGRQHPGVTQTTLGAICGQVGTWPHARVMESMRNLYGFASDYPGIRHGGTPASALRSIDMRDLVAISILLAGFTPYLTDLLNADTVYRGC
jgi:hypothetical protein